MRAVTLLLALAMTAPAQPHHVTLASLRDHKRVLLLFANGNNQQAEAQLSIAAQHAAEFKDRDLILVGVEGSDPAVPTALLTSSEEREARKRFQVAPGSFTIILLGKDGGEKLRSHTAFAWSTLQNTIDAMPMRQDEMHHR